MAEFIYRAVDQAGRAISGVVEAGSLEYARNQLQKNFRHIIELTPRKHSRAQTRGVGSDSLLIFTQQLAAMVTAAIPLTRALEVLAQSDNRILNDVCEQLSRNVSSGRSLSSSLLEFPRVFPRIYVSLVSTAEASGTLHIVLERLVELLKWEVAMKKRLLAVVTYPIALSVLASGVCALIVFYIFPALKPMFSMVGMELPAPTRLMIAIANFLRHPLTWVGLAALVGAAGYTWRHFQRLDGRARYRLDWLLLHSPVVGRMLWYEFGSRTLYAMALMLEAGINLNEVFRLLDQSVDNACLRSRLTAARLTMAEGTLLAESLRKHQVFHVHAIHMIAAGEESGRLPEMMRLVAQYYEQDLETRVEGLGAALEPIVLGIMGVVVGFVCIASLLPVIKFVQQI